MLVALIRSLRPTQWSKNAFVLAPLVFARQATDPGTLLRALAAFAAFSAASSAVYLINDVRDRERDRHHPLKAKRPIAAGQVTPAVALATAVVLTVAAVAVGWRLDPVVALILAGYVALNIAYSLRLKRVVILDVMVISAGFVLRVLAGANAISVQVSSWLILCTVFVSLFLAFSKRRHELMLLADNATDQRSVLGHYSPIFLDQMINVVSASTVVAYALYAVSPETAERFNTQHLVYTVPFVLFGIFRYLYLIYQHPGERNPTEELLSDPPFLTNVLAWGAAVVWIVYGS